MNLTSKVFLDSSQFNKKRAFVNKRYLRKLFLIYIRIAHLLMFYFPQYFASSCGIASSWSLR